MDYYNRQFNKFDRNHFEYLNQGSCAHIDYNHDIIFKQYFFYTELNCRLKVCLFDILKDIDNPYFIKLIDIYTKTNLLFFKMSKKIFTIDAYSAKYYEKENINVLKEPSEYLLDSFRGLEILFDIFSENAILTDDLHCGNIVFTSQGMVIIDPDFFKLYKEKDLMIKNKRNLLNLFRDICGCMLDLESKYTYKEINNIVNKFTDFQVDEKTSLAYELKKN